MGRLQWMCWPYKWLIIYVYMFLWCIWYYICVIVDRGGEKEKWCERWYFASIGMFARSQPTIFLKWREYDGVIVNYDNTMAILMWKIFMIVNILTSLDETSNTRTHIYILYINRNASRSTAFVSNAPRKSETHNKNTNSTFHLCNKAHFHKLSCYPNYQTWQYYVCSTIVCWHQFTSLIYYYRIVCPLSIANVTKT